MEFYYRNKRVSVGEHVKKWSYSKILKTFTFEGDDSFALEIAKQLGIEKPKRKYKDVEGEK